MATVLSWGPSGTNNLLALFTSPTSADVDPGLQFEFLGSIPITDQAALQEGGKLGTGIPLSTWGRESIL